MLTIEQLLTPLTKDQVKQKLYDLAAALGLSTTAWFSGAPTRTLIAVLAEIYGAFISPLLVAITQSGFLDEAEQGWLTRLASKFYGVDRRLATFATGEITLDNAGGGVFSFDIAEAVFKNSTTNATYTNTEAFTLAAFQTGLDVAVRAVTIGSAGNATATQVDTIVTTMAQVSVTNAADLVGQDEENDPDLRQRCRDKLGALSPDGPAAAYRFVALTPELNGGANIDRVKVKPALGDGTVTVLLASPDGTPTSPDVALVQAGFDEWATPDTALATAVGASEFAYSVSATVKVNAAAGLTDSEWEDLIKADLIAWVRTLPIEGLVFPPATSGIIPFRSVIGVIERVRTSSFSPYFVLHATLGSEADVSVPADDVVTLDSGDITLTIVQVTVPP